MLAAQQPGTAWPARCWAEEGVALGRRLAPLLPEDRHDRGPVFPTPRETLVADVRLDNRTALAAALGLRPADTERLPDATLLGMAWAEWREDALQRLVGDFAFAVWNAAERSLSLARDFAGHAPLCFWRGKEGVAFASMPRGLQALPFVPTAFSRDDLADFLACSRLAPGRTYFEGLERVDPGELVVITPAGIRRGRWWQPDLTPLRLGTSRDYVDGVRERLEQAVTAQLRGGGDRVGAQLSAGLDSSAVTAVAAKQMEGRGRVIAFTAAPAEVVDDRSSLRLADEAALAAASAALYANVEHVVVRPPISGLPDLDRIHSLVQQPIPDLPNAHWQMALNDAAAARGITVLLHGAAGNLGFSHDGLDLLSGRLRRLEWLSLARDLARLRAHGHRLRTAAGWALWPLLPGLWRRRHSGRGVPVGLSDYSLLTADPAGGAGDAAFAPKAVTPALRRDAVLTVDPGQYRKAVLLGWGIDLRDPTADRRLIEFCLRIPSDQYLQGGVPRALARRLLAGLVPDAVLSERRRGYQSADWPRHLAAGRDIVSRELAPFAGMERLAGMIDEARTARLAAASGELDWSDPKSQSQFRVALLRAVSAGHFARRVSGWNG